MDKMRWRYGDTEPVVAKVNNETEIEIGDLLYQVDGKVYPLTPDVICASSLRQFLGVAMQRSRKGNETPIRVATRGVFEFDCLNLSCDIGSPIQPIGKQDVRHTLLELPIGLAAIYCTDRTSILVDIRSRIMGHGL